MTKLHKYILFSAIALATSPAYGSMVVRSIAQKAVAATRLVPAVAAPKMFARAVSIKQQTHQQIKPVVTQQHNKKSTHDSYTKPRSYKWAAIGAAIMLGHAGYQVAQCQKKEKPIWFDLLFGSNNPYKPLFEESRKKYDEYLLRLPWGDKVGEKYIPWRDNTWQELMKEFYRLADCTEKEFLEYCSREVGKIRAEEQCIRLLLPIYNLFAMNLTSISPSLQIDINHALHLVHIDHRAITAHSFAMNFLKAHMFAMRSKLFINGETCNGSRSITTDYDKFGLMHETQHLLWDDALSGHVMKKILADKNIDISIRNSFFLKLGNFQEKRADIFGCLSDIRLAEANHKRLHECLTQEIAKYAKSSVCEQSQFHAIENARRNDVHDSPLAQFTYMDPLVREMQEAELKKQNSIWSFLKNKDQITT